MTLEDVSADIEVRYRSMRLNRAQNVWNVEALLTNKSTRVVQGPLILFVESFTGTAGPVQPDSWDDSAQPRAFYDFSASVADGALSPAEITAEKTLKLAVSSGAPTLVTKVFAAPNRGDVALALVRSLNEVGQPLTGVQIDEVGPAGPTNLTTDPVFAVATVGQGSGPHMWKFSAPGYLAVWRQQNLSTGEVVIVASPRLTRRGTNTVTITLLDGGQMRDSPGSIQINFAAGAVTQNTTATLTPLTGQTLPALLPRGWSPLEAFWLELSGPVSTPATTSLKPSAVIGSGETAALVRLNENTMQWEVTQLLAGNGTNSITATLTVGGAYALVVGDLAPIAPPAPQIGQALQPSAAGVPDLALLTASGQVIPSSSPASRVPELVTASAEVILSHPSNALPSGLVLRGEVVENYRLSDGTGRHPPEFENFMVGYQRPGDSSANTLHASFPLRPLFLFGSEELEEATVKVDVLTPTPFGGSVLDARGGQASADGLRVLAGSGDVIGQQAAQLRRLNPTNFLDLVSTNVPVVAAFDLTVGGIASGRRLATQLGPLPTNGHFTVARVLYDQGQYGLQPLERLATDAAGRLNSAEPLSGDRLDGIIGAGQYVIIQLSAQQGLVQGIARNSASQPTANMPVRIGGQPWLAFSRADGSFKLLAPTGSVNVAVTDPATGDTGQTTLVVTDPNATANTSLASAAAGPRVVSINPTNGAVNVSRVTPIEIAFSEPANPVTLIGNAIQLLGTNGQPVAASLTLNLKNSVATLLPTEQLSPSALHTVRLSTNIADATGLKLEGANTFTFTTESDRLNRGRAELVIFEPGATNIPANVLANIPAFQPGEEKDAVVVEGKPGSAEPERPVILINESTGETSTVMSKPDGSFYGLIRGDVDDFVSATILNGNGTRTSLPVSRQRFDDGFVGLFGQGGILEAESDGGPVQVLVEPGAIPTKTKFKVDLIDVQELLRLLNNTQPLDGKLVGAVRYSEEGSEPRQASDISFPVSVGDLGLPPGSEPADGSYALVIPRKSGDQVAYEVIDRMSFEATGPGQGKLVTRSPPFPGILSRTLKEMRSNLQRQTGMQSVSGGSSGSAQPNIFTEFLGFVAFQFGAGVEVAGKVTSRRVDSGGQPLGDARPVAGAVVCVDFPTTGGVIGLLRSGEMIATSDLEGHYAYFVRLSDFQGGRVMRATHPRFPFQKAVSAGISPASGETGSARADLQFVQSGASGGGSGAEDTTPPQVAPSHNPALPAPGSQDPAGTTLSVIAIDDVRVTTVEVIVTRVETLSGELLPEGTITLSAQPEQRPSPARFLQNFRVHGTSASRATLTINASDAGGNQTSRDYAIIFGGTPVSVTPVNPNDTTRPRVVLAWPLNGSPSVPSLMPIRLRFSEPLAAPYLEPGALDWISFGFGHHLTSVHASADRRDVTVYYDGPTDGDVQLTLGPPLADQNNNAFDQNPKESGNQPFILGFTQTGRVQATLEGITRGSGVVFLGRFAYALDRLSSEEGMLRAFDLNNPVEPEELDTQSLDGLPTELSLVPGYSLPTDADVENGSVADFTCEDVNLLAAFTGAANETKRLSLVRIRSDGELGGIVSGPISASPASMITKSKWDPPYLGYLELGAGVSSVNLLNLTAFHIGSPLSRSQLPAEPVFGVDANADGDFCDKDLGDVVPLPGKDDQPRGLEFSWAPEDPREVLVDFDFHSGLGLVGVVFAVNDGSKPSGYRTVLAGSDPANLDDAVVSLAAGDRPKRVFLLPAAKLETATGITVKDLALVSVVGEPGAIVVVDVTVAATPAVLTRIALPTGEGSANSIVLRDDGLLALATGQNTLLLDPAKLIVPQTTLHHPAFVGVIEGTGGGTRSFVSDTSGVNLVSASGNNRLVQDAPRFEFVTFPETPFLPANVIEQRPPSGIAALMRSAEVVREAQPVKFEFEEGQATPPRDPRFHYYVRLTAPGSSGEIVDLVLASVNVDGRLANRGLKRTVPAVLADEETAADGIIGRVLSICTGSVGGTTLRALGDDFIRQLINYIKRLSDYPGSFKARRLSNDPTSPLFNQYLAGPFLILSRELAEHQLEALEDQMERSYLIAGPFVWTGLAPSMKNNPVIGRYTSLFAVDADRTPILTLDDLLPSTDDLVLAVALGGTAGTGVLDAFLDPMQDAVNGAQSSGAKVDPLILPGASTIVPVAFRFNPVVFVHGVMGSHLESASGGIDASGNEWIGLGDFAKAELNLDKNQNSTTEITTSDMMRSVLGVPVYGEVIRFLTNNLGYVEYRFMEPISSEDEFDAQKKFTERRRDLSDAPFFEQRPVPDLFVFPYDWRQSNEKSAQKLREYIDLVFAFHPEASQVDIIAHSMGGLVSRRFMLDNPGMVGRFISIGTPWLGSAKCLKAMKTGDFDEIAMNVIVPFAALRRLGVFMPSVHQLLPAKGLFDLGFAPVVETGWDANENGIFYERYDYTTYLDTVRQYLFKEEVTEADPTVTESPAAVNHDSFHSYQGGAIGDWRNDNTGIEYHHIIGMQSVPQSVGRVALTTWLTPITNNPSDVILEAPAVEFFEQEDVFANPPEPAITAPPDRRFPAGGQRYRLDRAMQFVKVSGDGTVPLLSASRGFGASGSLNAPGAHLYAVVSPGIKEDQGAQHNGMLNNTNVHRWLADILSGTTPKTVDLDVTVAGPFVEGSSLSFSASAGANFPLTGTPTFLWDFGDGATLQVSGSSDTVQHQYHDNGPYTVSCGVTYPNGITGFTSRTVTIANAPPVPEIEGGTTLIVGTNRIFEAKINDPGTQDHHEVTWELDGVVRLTNSFLLPLTFSAPGQHQLKAKVRDNDGATAETQITLEVVPPGLAPQSGRRPIAPSAPDPEPLGQPEIYVRVSGQAFGFIGFGGVRISDLTTDGVEILNDNTPPIIVGTGLSIGNSLQGAVLKYVNSIGTDNSDLDSVFVDVFRSTNISTGQLIAKTEINFTGGASDTVMVDAFYREGGVAKQFASWELIDSEGEDFTFTMNWEPRTLSLSSGFFGGSIVPRAFVTGAAAEDIAAPAIAGLMNPNTREIYLVGRDRFTPESKLLYYFAEDANEDGRFEDETFRQLTETSFHEGVTPTRPITLIARDELGNYSGYNVFSPISAGDFDFSHTASTNAPSALAPADAGPSPSGRVAKQDAGDETYCDQIDRIRDAVRNVILAGFGDSRIREFVLATNDVWFFEQGTGACLWKANSCQTCEQGGYKIGKSDNDYELFMPVHKEFAMDRNLFLTVGPHNEINMTGDWYFKEPVGLDAGGNEIAPTIDGAPNPSAVKWRYVVPSGLTTLASETVVDKPRASDPENPFANPRSPAQLIAFYFTDLVKSDPERKKVLPDVSFFPFRREHFLFGLMSLERPPPFGDDPIGDAGMGRQLLLLKWLLEGAFVTFAGSSAVNGDVPADVRTRVFENLKLSGIPLAEGFEWGVYQDFAALGSGARLRAVEISDDGDPSAPLKSGMSDYFNKHDEKTIKKIGKAAIRATLARLAGDSQHNAVVLSVTPAQYDANSQVFKSWEHFIAHIASSSSAAPAFGPFASRIPEFLQAKLADPEFTRRLIHEGRVDQFIQDGFRFLREQVQNNTESTYQTYVASLLSNLQFDELDARLGNLNAVEQGFRPSGSSRFFPGRLQMLGLSAVHTNSYDLVFQVQNRAGISINGVVVTFDPGGDGQTQVQTLSAFTGASPPIKGDASKGEPFFFVRKTTEPEERTATVTMTTSLPAIEDALVNNDIRFKHYLLPNVALPDVAPGRPELRAHIRLDLFRRPEIEFTLIQNGASVTGTFEILNSSGNFVPLSDNTLAVDEAGTLIGSTNDIVVRGTSGGVLSFNTLQFAQTLEPIFADGMRRPTPGEWNLLDLVSQDFASENETEAQEFAVLMRFFLEPIYTSVLNAATLADFDALTNRLNAVFATESEACARIDRYLSLQLDYFNPGRHRHGNRTKTGEQGRIYLNTGLRSTTPITMAGGVRPGLDIIKTEVLHEVNYRANRLVRNDEVRRAPLNYQYDDDAPNVRSEHRFLDDLLEADPVIRNTISAYPTQRPAVRPTCQNQGLP